MILTLVLTLLYGSQLVYDFIFGTLYSAAMAAQGGEAMTSFRPVLTRKQKAPEQAAYYIPEETEPEKAEEQPKEYGYNVLEIDWDALNARTEDETLLAINDYCSQLTGTRQNEYTGLLKDYNLIVMCAESFDTGAIQPEITPNLYKLSQQGILFENYYNSFTTTDGEYTLLQGLYPDTGRSKAVSSLYASRASYLPFTLGNAFGEQRGFQCWGLP